MSLLYLSSFQFTRYPRSIICTLKSICQISLFLLIHEGFSSHTGGSFSVVLLSKRANPLGRRTRIDTTFRVGHLEIMHPDLAIKAKTLGVSRRFAASFCCVWPPDLDIRYEGTKSTLGDITYKNFLGAVWRCAWRVVFRIGIFS